MSSPKLFLFGPPRLEKRGKAIKVSLRKALALLAYLAVTQQSHSRDALATLFWPDDSQRKARANLRRTLSRLNKALGKGWLEIDRENAGLNPKASLWLDVDQFQYRLAQCQTHGHASTEVCPDCLPALTEAAELYADDFLVGFSLPDCPDFDEWQFFQSEGLRQALASALERLVRGHSEQDDYDVAIPHARRWLALDTLHEPAHRQLMELYAQTGQQAAAARQYEECARVLDEELGILPSEETTALYEVIKAKRLPRSKADKRENQVQADFSSAPLLPGPPAPLRNLPPQPTPFIGREAELAALDNLIANSGARLVTIVGPGGMGKTRLALALAERQLETDRFPSGVYLINLAPLSSAGHVIPAMVEALKFPLDTGEQQTRTPKQQILDYLRQKQMLLVLDNFEHLLSPPSVPPNEEILEGSISGAEELVIDILQTAADVQILVTSRERLHLHEEQIFPLRGLTFPDVETVKPAVEYDAVKLFGQSARRVRPDFELGTDDISDVTHVCRLVEGLPLGLELAASWVDMLSLAGIAAEIQKSLDILETDVRNVPQRQRSIRAVFDASWQRMSAAEQKIFPQLAVFRGGFTRRAAQKITGASLRLLGTLSSKSMLQYNKDRDRYQIHELLRQYGAEKLSAASAEESDVRDRHSAYYCAALRQREDELKGGRQQTALREIEADSENVRAAWHWAVQQENIEQLVLAMNALGTFYEWQGRFRDGAAAFRALLASPFSVSVPHEPLFWAKAMAWASVFQRMVETTEVAHETLAQALKLLEGLESSVDGRAEQAFLHYQQGNLVLSQNNAAAQAAFLTSLGFYRQVEDQWGVARALHGLGETFHWLGDFAAAGLHLAESLALYRALGDLRGLAAVTLTASMTARYHGRLEESLRLGEECLEISQQIGNRSLMAEALGDLSMSHGRSFGRYAQAHDFQDQGLTIAADLGNPWQLSNAYYRRGELAAHLGNFKAAEDDLRQAIVVDQKSGYRIIMAYALAALGQLLTAVGEQAEARRALSEALSTCREIDHLDGTLICTIYLTLLERDSGSRWKAEQELFEILKGSYKRQAWVPYELALPVIAAFLVEPPEITDGELASGRLLLAIEIAGLVDRGSRLRQRLIFDHLNELAACLPPDVVTAAKERGRQMDWWPMAAYLLKALPKLGWGQPEAEAPGSQEAGGQRGRGAGEKLPPHNLPPQPTPFIGRETELAEITQHLTDPNCRLLTLIGPGGIGKTRLALEAGARLLPDGAFPGGIYFVPLAALSSADFLVSTLAEPLDFSFQGDADPQVQLLDYLADLKQAMLLVLDNFEQLAEGADLLAAILQHAPAVKLLVTSRERLNLRDEWLLDLQGLPFPASLQSGKALAGYGAVQLFLETAARLKATFSLSEANKSHLVRICQLVEGMPLGLELAAAWVRVLSCREIAQEIEQNLEFLTTSLRDVPARHRSLIAVFDHSWNHLSAEEQRVFRSLAVFRGGFSREAAEMVAGDSLPLLAALVDKSMLRRNDLGRYELHELLRQYAADKLDEAGDTEQARDRHLSFFLELAEEAEPKLQGTEQAMWLKKLNSENDNLRAALSWSLEAGEAAAGLRLAVALGLFWHMRGHRLSEGSVWLERILARTEASEPTAIRARAYRRLGYLTYRQGDHAAARSAYEKSLALYRVLGNKDGMADSLFNLGDIAAAQSDNVSARSFYAEARSASEENLAILRERGDIWRVARSLVMMGELARSESDYAAARSFYEESLTLRRELGDEWGIANSLINLMYVACRQGNYRQAATFMGECLALCQKLEVKPGIMRCIAGFACVAGGMGQPEWAARLFGAVEALREASQIRLEHIDRIEEDRNIDTVRAQLDHPTFAAAWAEGRQLTMEQAVQEALMVGEFMGVSVQPSATDPTSQSS